MGFPGDSEVKNLLVNSEDKGLIPGSDRSPGEGNGNLFQYSCLENPRDRGDYKVIKIEGEYATLQDTASGTELFIALALLPEGTDLGTKLHFEMLEYTIIDD